MLHLKNLSKEFAGKPLFTDINWHLKKGERAGLVGENGAGKSTLMRIIAGQVEHTGGALQFAKGATVGYLPQDGIVTYGRTLFAEAMSALDELQRIESELHGLTLQLESLPHDDPGHEEMLERLGHLQEEFRLKGGYSMEAEVGNVLRGLGFATPDWERDCAEFSGGWQMRIALARLLLKKPNVLLLDEPTNHLDIEARNWLEEYLKSYPFSVILVSHDRFFLDQVCHRIVEVWNHTLTDYHCDYSSYLVRREERVTALREAKRRQDEEIQKIEDFISRFRYKADKASLVQSRIKQLDKIERILLPPVHLLHERRKHVLTHYELIPVHIELGFNPERANALKDFFEARHLSHHIEFTHIGLKANSAENRENPCFLCSWERRKRIFHLAHRLKCNKIALGHHKDDIIETLLLNIFYSGEISTMLPLQSLFKGKIALIRPLALLEEKKIERFAREMDLPVGPSGCPSSGKTKRGEVKELIEVLGKKNRRVKGNIFRSLSNVKMDYTFSKWKD